MPNGSEIYIIVCPKQPKPILFYARKYSFMFLILLSIITVGAADNLVNGIKLNLIQWYGVLTSKILMSTKEKY
jgi:hypothetical protein